VRFVWFIAALTVAGCDSSNGNPCTTCPPLGGTWVFQFDTGMATGCSSLGTLPTSMVIDQQSSVISTYLNGADLSGSLFDTYEFSLNGTIPSQDGGFDFVVQVQGLYVPSQATDGGDDRIDQGIFSRSTDSCQEDTPFKAVR
jgi:hypothetical protein